MLHHIINYGKLIETHFSECLILPQTIQVIQPSNSTTIFESDEHCFIEFDNIVSQAI